MDEQTCDNCPDPGVCCERFFLIGCGGAIHFDPATYGEGAETPERFLARYALPFRFLRLLDNGAAVFTCPLIVDGRCSDYENRPALCRVFAVNGDRACAHHWDHAAGQAEIRAGEPPVSTVENRT